MVKLLNKEAQEDLTDDVKEGKHKEETKVVSPVKVTVTPSKEGDQEPVEQILTLESEPDTGADSDGSKKSSKSSTYFEIEKFPLLCLLYFKLCRSLRMKRQVISREKGRRETCQSC